MKRLLRCGKELRFRVSVIVVAVLALFITTGDRSSEAAGLLIADGGFGGVLEIKEHAVNVTINNGVAVTRVTQVFHNTEKRQVEALYTFPVPRGASVANFSMWIGGKEMIGEVLEKERARQIYDSYKRKRRDPGLLEQVDYKTFEMRIFPINAGADQKVELTYYQELSIDHDRLTYVYPLATVTRQDIDSRATARFAINVDVKSAVPITGMESPSHGDAFVIANHSETYAQASLESSTGSLAKDVVIHCNLSRPKTGLDLITSKSADEDGYFYLTLTAGKDLADRDDGMDYVFLLDISGSMGNDRKLATSRNSLEAFITELAEDDRFEVMTFNVRPNTLFGQLQPASETFKVNAEEFMRSQQARGGTVLIPAMTAAYRYGEPDRILNVVILSDGMTEQKERQELLQLIDSRPANARVFCIGVGNEVNRPLLEQMAEDSGGLAAFISGGDNFKQQAKAFRRKLMHPVATDLELDIDGVTVLELEPRKLPNLFHGSPIRIYGRYAESGQARVTLKGLVRGMEINQAAWLEFPAQDAGNPEIERMWALKRVDRLQKMVNREGARQPVIDEIVKLGETFSIVTEYTSFLVLENDAEYQRWKIERRNALRMGRDRQAQSIRQKELDAIRDRAASDIGPQPVVVARKISQKPVNPQVPPAAQPQPRTQAPAPAKNRNTNQSRDLNFGTGPVGPLFVVLAAWLTRRKRRR